jgi:hypothetical protein
MLAKYQSLSKELTSMIFLPTRRFIHRPLVAAGWDKKVTMWSDSTDQGCENLHIGTTQFTCFTSTKVQLLTSDEADCEYLHVGTQFTCFTSTKVQILTPEELQGSHPADILCLHAVDRPTVEGATGLLVLSGDAHGNLFVWTAGSGRLAYSFTADSFSGALLGKPLLC